MVTRESLPLFKFLIHQVYQIFHECPSGHLCNKAVDQGYLDHQNIIKVQKSGCEVYVNPKTKRKAASEKKVNEIHEEEHCELAKWRIRMGMDEAKEIYKDRASNSEWANAGMRNRGLRQFLVRGLKNIQSVLNLHVLTHNVLRAIKLGYAW